MEVMEELKKDFILKGVGVPEYFLGANFKHVQWPENIFIMGSTTYVKRIIETFEKIMGFKPPKNIYCPLDPKDSPELDMSDFLDDKGKTTYASLLGMFQWAVTLGRIDICVVVMTMREIQATTKGRTPQETCKDLQFPSKFQVYFNQV